MPSLACLFSFSFLDERPTSNGAVWITGDDNLPAREKRDVGAPPPEARSAEDRPLSARCASVFVRRPSLMEMPLALFIYAHGTGAHCH